MSDCLNLTVDSISICDETYECEVRSELYTVLSGNRELRLRHPLRIAVERILHQPQLHISRIQPSPSVKSVTVLLHIGISMDGLQLTRT